MAQSSDASTPDSGLAAPQSIQKSFSCVLCAQRKVKCDKAPGGCANCTKARVDCVYKAPPPPRRRKKGLREIDVHARLRLYEDALRKLGVDPDELVKQEVEKAARKGESEVIGINDVKDINLPIKPPTAKATSGFLIAGDGKSRYLENTLWASVKGEFRDSKELLDDTSSDEEEDGPHDAVSPSALSSDGASLLMGTLRTSTNLGPLHPQPVQIFKLWQTYLDNINPLIKIGLHTPTAQQIVSDASGHLDSIPKNIEALLFSIYTLSVESLSEVECDAIMGEPKAVVSSRFKTAVQHALINANFLRTSDIMVLQALVLFITAMGNYDGRVIWILTGVAHRIGQRIGLHRDPETLGLPPFESEIRRRLWWQIIMMDGFAEKLAGTGGNVLIGDVKRPSNLNDSDLFPGMKELPKDHEGATEMMFFLIKCHVGEFLKRSRNNRDNFDGVWNKLSTNSATLASKDKAISELETIIERKFLRYCDKSVPWHSMCWHLAKATVSMLRFIAHNPEHHGGSSADLPQSERDMLFRSTLGIMEFQNIAYTTKEMQGYLWHINSHFQWKGFIYVLSELRHRTDGPEVDGAWKQIKLVYDFHPNFAKDLSRRAMPIAVGNLTLKAWDAYTAARGIPEGGEPYFIQVLRARQAKRDASTSPSNATLSSPPSEPSPAATATKPPFYLPQGFASAVLQPSSTADPLNTDALQNFQWDANFAASLEVPQVIPDLPPLDPDQMTWANWDNIIQDFEMNGSNGFAMDGSGFNFGLQ